MCEVSRAVRKYCQSKHLPDDVENDCANRAMHAYRTSKRKDKAKAIRQGKALADSIGNMLIRETQYRPAQMSA